MEHVCLFTGLQRNKQYRDTVSNATPVYRQRNSSTWVDFFWKQNREAYTTGFNHGFCGYI